MSELAVQYIRTNVKKGFLDYSQHALERMLVVAASFPNPVVATVCKFEKEVWEYINGVMKRRQDNG